MHDHIWLWCRCVCEETIQKRVTKAPPRGQCYTTQHNCIQWTHVHAFALCLKQLTMHSTYSVDLGFGVAKLTTETHTRQGFFAELFILFHIRIKNIIETWEWTFDHLATAVITLATTPSTRTGRTCSLMFDQSGSALFWWTRQGLESHSWGMAEM